jgi:hypothetical protein
MTPGHFDTPYDALKSAINKYFINFILPAYILFIVLNTQISGTIAMISITGFFTGLLILVGMVGVVMVSNKTSTAKYRYSVIEHEHRHGISA